jgi:hypothetical protein
MSWISENDESPANGDYRVCKNNFLTFIATYIEGTGWFYVCPLNHLEYVCTVDLPDSYTKIEVTHWQQVPS